MAWRPALRVRSVFSISCVWDAAIASALYMLWAMPTILHPNNVSPRSVPSSDCSAGAVAQRDRHPDGEPTLQMLKCLGGPLSSCRHVQLSRWKTRIPQVSGFSKFKSNPPNKQLRFTLPETNSKSPWKSMVGRWNFLLGFGLFWGASC